MTVSRMRLADGVTTDFFVMRRTVTPALKGPGVRTSTHVLAVQSRTSAQCVCAVQACSSNRLLALQLAMFFTRQLRGVWAAGVNRPHATFVEPQAAPLLMAVAVFLHSRRRSPAATASFTAVRTHRW